MSETLEGNAKRKEPERDVWAPEARLPDFKIPQPVGLTATEAANSQTIEDSDELYRGDVPKTAVRRPIETDPDILKVLLRDDSLDLAPETPWTIDKPKPANPTDLTEAQKKVIADINESDRLANLSRVHGNKPLGEPSRDIPDKGPTVDSLTVEPIPTPEPIKTEKIERRTTTTPKPKPAWLSWLGL